MVCTYLKCMYSFCSHGGVVGCRAVCTHPSDYSRFHLPQLYLKSFLQTSARLSIVKNFKTLNCKRPIWPKRFQENECWLFVCFRRLWSIVQVHCFEIFNCTWVGISPTRQLHINSGMEPASFTHMFLLYNYLNVLPSLGFVLQTVMQILVS